MWTISINLPQTDEFLVGKIESSYLIQAHSFYNAIGETWERNIPHTVLEGADWLFPSSLIIFFANSSHKPLFRSLLQWLSRIGVENHLRAAFDHDLIEFKEMRALFYREYAKTFDWAQSDRLDIENMYRW